MASGQQSFSNTTTGSQPADPYTMTNKDDALAVADKIHDLSTFISGCKFGMMTTRESATGNLVSRCMALAAKETGDIDLLFHTNTESGKTDDIATDPHINLAFLDTWGQWASISGTSEVLTDRALVEKHYTPTLKAWVGDLGDGKHDGGPQDPRIGVIRVKMITATYALSSKNLLGRAAEVAQSTVTGKVAHVNKLREISKDEVENWRLTH